MDEFESEFAIGESGDGHYVVLDVEVQRSMDEVGGWSDWRNVRKTGLAVAVIWCSKSQDFSVFFEEDVEKLVAELLKAPLVVGYNVDRFDLAVLSGYPGVRVEGIQTLDLLGCLMEVTGERVSLAELAEVNLPETWKGKEVNNVRLWKEGLRTEVVIACKMDVEIIRDLYQLARARRWLLVPDEMDGARKIELM